MRAWRFLTVCSVVALGLVGCSGPAPATQRTRADFTNSVGMKMVYIQPGSFMMGPTTFEERRYHDDGPQHEVTISRGFYMGAHEVTNAQYRQFKPEHDSGRESLTSLNEDDQPVVRASWNDAVAFCKWLSRKEGRTYRLPTEAEWEYACRAGTITPFAFGETLTVERANFDDGQPRESDHTGIGVVNSVPVGRFKPNAWGLYDMHGNVEEWCHDRYDSGYYAVSPPVDPQGPKRGSLRVRRGGYWTSPPALCRSAWRTRFPPYQSGTHIGFRVVCEASSTD